MESQTIPRQKKGASFDVRAKLIITDREQAIEKYVSSRQRLLDVSGWGSYAGESPDTFILTNSQGSEMKAQAKEGDKIKVHLPGPRSLTGDGADWVVVEKILEERNKLLDEIFTAVILRPCANPFMAGKETAHFYTNRSTNTLLVCRHRIEIIASIHGRNEQVNMAANWLEMIRNMMVAIPAKVGLSNPHWRKLAKGLIKDTI